MATPSHEVVLSGLLNGDPESEKVVRRWISDYVGYLARGSAVDHRDLCSECFVALYEAVNDGRYRGDGLKSYIRTICVRKFYGRLEDRRRHPDGPHEEAAATSTESLTSDELALRVLRVTRLKRVLMDLPKSERSVLLLRAMGRSYDEIAQLLKTSNGAARKAACMAVKKVLELIDRQKKA